MKYPDRSVTGYTMKPNCYIFLLIVLVFLVLAILSGCQGVSRNNNGEIDYRKEMRAFVESIAEYARSKEPNFIIIPQNGAELVSSTGEANGPADMNYLAAINGMGQESLFYGYLQDDVETPPETTEWTSSFLDLARDNGNIRILVTDYCSTPSKMDISYSMNNSRGYISFAADHRGLDDIPGYPAFPYNSNSSDIAELSQAKNFLYLIDPENYGSVDTYTKALADTDYDVIIMDLFFASTALTSNQVSGLKTKASGGKRLLIAYMSIGEAEDYRYYWKVEWAVNPPKWLKEENPDWPGNYKVEYWDKDWQDIIYGNKDSYIEKILAAGFDGAYLDIIDAFEYFEEAQR